MQSGAAGELPGSHNTRCPSLLRNLGHSWYPAHVQTETPGERQTPRDSLGHCQRHLAHFIRCYWLKMLTTGK